MLAEIQSQNIKGVTFIARFGRIENVQRSHFFHEP